MTYVKNRFIRESRRVISNILKISSLLPLEGDLFTAFYLFNHCLLLPILWKLGFGIDFVNCIKTISNNQVSFIISRGKTAKYFKLKRSAQQVDPISTYLLRLV